MERERREMHFYCCISTLDLFFYARTAVNDNTSRSYLARKLVCVHISFRSSSSSGFFLGASAAKAILHHSLIR